MAYILSLMEWLVVLLWCVGVCWGVYIVHCTFILPFILRCVGVCTYILQTLLYFMHTSLFLWLVVLLWCVGVCTLYNVQDVHCRSYKLYIHPSVCAYISSVVVCHIKHALYFQLLCLCIHTIMIHLYLVLIVLSVCFMIGNMHYFMYVYYQYLLLY